MSTGEQEPAATFRARRADLADQFDSIDSAVALFAFQEQLVTEIRAAEPAAFRNRASPHREHIKVLRLMGDAVAWTTLHPHTIRQLAKHPGKPPAIGSQGSAFDFVLNCARLVAEAGRPARICDLTNVLRVGDLVIGDSERPMLIECGPDASARFEGRGRKGRQTARMDAVSDLLNNGRGNIPGTLTPIVVHQTHVDMHYSWEAVTQAAGAALTDGAGLAGGDGDVVWAVRADSFRSGDFPLAERAVELTAGFEDPLVALSSVVLDRPSPLIPPPLAWPLPLEVRRALLERDIHLLHVIDLSRYRIEHGGARVVEIRRDTRGNLLEPCFTIQRSDGLVAAASSRFIDEVIHGFVTIDSAARLMLSGVSDIGDGKFESDGIDLEEARRGPLGPIIDELLNTAEPRLAPKNCTRPPGRSVLPLPHQLLLDW